MIKLIAIMKSHESYKRLKFQIDSNKIEWEEYIRDLDDLREKLFFIHYDVAIVDENIWWKNEAIELFEKFDTDVFIFEGDFEDINNKVLSKIPKEENNENITKDEEINDNTDNDDRPIRYIEKKVIEKQEVKVKVPVYTEVYTNIPKKLILVVNLSKRAGATFLTLNLAKALSELKILTSVIEVPLYKPYIFDTIGLEQRLNKTTDEESLNFYSYAHEILEGNKIEKDRETIEDGIIWIIPDPRKPLIDSKQWDYYNMMKLLYCSRKPSITIVDIGDFIEHESIKPIVDEADMILVVVDPMPTEIMQNTVNIDNFLEFKQNGISVEFIFNRWTSGINKKELMSFFNIKPLSLIPYIDLQYIHSAIYNCQTPYSLTEVKNILEKPLYQIIKNVVPSEYFKQNDIDVDSNKRSIFSLFRLKKRSD